jgi:phospholipid/cholesterol/gamma-HCH transport system substrate-binding protein
MARRLDWSDVRGGLIASAAIIGISLVTLKYARVGALRGDTVRLYALVGEARGILSGSEVWLSGQKIGKVTDIQFRPPELADSSSHLLLELEVLERYGTAVRKDAVAQIRSGGSLIGAIVVSLTPGSAAMPAVTSGDTIRARRQLDTENAAAQFSGVARQIPGIVADLKVIRGQLEPTSGSIGPIMKDGLSGPAITQTRAQLARLQSQLDGGRGSLGRIMNGGLGARAQRVMSRADSVRALVASSSTTLGRFRKDSTLAAEIADIRNELSIVRALLAEPRGTMGRMSRDSALTNAVGDAQREMSLLFADVKKHPLRYISF